MTLLSFSFIWLLEFSIILCNLINLQVKTKIVFDDGSSGTHSNWFNKYCLLKFEKKSQQCHIFKKRGSSSQRPSDGLVAQLLFQSNRLYSLDTWVSNLKASQA